MTRQVEIEITLIGDAKTGHRGLHVRYRYRGGRKTVFRCDCSDGQSLGDLLSVALAVVDRDREAAPSGEQLRIDHVAGAAA